MKGFILAVAILFGVGWIVLTIAFSSWYQGTFENTFLAVVGNMLATFFCLGLLEVLLRYVKRYFEG